MYYQKTWKPVAAGVLDIICCILYGPGIMLFILISLLGLGMAYEGPFEDLLFMAIFIAPLAMVILALTGGIFAIKRRRWRLALTGAVSVFLGAATGVWFFSTVKELMFLAISCTAMVITIASIVLTVQSKNEFE